MVNAVDHAGDVTDQSPAVKVTQSRGLVENGDIIRGFVSVVVTRVDGTKEVLCHNKENLLATEGRDKFHEAVYQNATATQAAFNFIGLSNDVGTPTVGDTRTTWELIEESGNGLDRIQASSRTRTPGTNATQLQHTFTASAIVTGVRWAATLDRITTANGFLGHENTFTNADLQIGDQITITWDFTLG